MTEQTNNSKRTFLQTVFASLAFVLLGGIGGILSIANNNKQNNNNSTSGFGNGGYGK
jgi:hypothetical protein